MVRAGASELLRESELTAEVLQQRLIALLLSPERLLEMSARARATSRPDALQQIAAMAVSLRRAD